VFQQCLPDLRKLWFLIETSNDRSGTRGNSISKGAFSEVPCAKGAERYYNSSNKLSGTTMIMQASLENIKYKLKYELDLVKTYT